MGKSFIYFVFDPMTEVHRINSFKMAISSVNCWKNEAGVFNFYSYYFLF